MEPVAAQLQEILDQLGDSPDKVAAALGTQGIQGVPNSVRILNPIIRFVQGALLISIFGMDLMNRDALRVRLLDGREVETPVPQAVKDFLDAFNQGAYPELEMPVAKAR